MQTRSRDSARAAAEPIPLAPSEKWAVAHLAVLSIFLAWAYGGMAGWVRTGAFALTLAGLPLLLLRYRESGRFSLRAFIPALLWAVYNLIALGNPSHTPAPNGGWQANPDWLRWLPTTTDRAHTLEDARFWLTALVTGGLAATLIRTTKAARLLWGTIALNGFALAAAGAGFHFTGAELMLGTIETPEPTYFFATFFYKNHWAAYGALVAVAATTLALRAWPAAVAGDPRARGRAALLGAAGLLTAITLPLPGSRAGAAMAAAIIVGFLGLLLFGWWRGTMKRSGPRWGAGAGLAVAIGIVAFGVYAYGPRAAIDLQRTRQQFTHHFDGEALDTRVLVSRDTWRMALARPWFGWGPGCYEIVFPVFQGNYLRGPDGRAVLRFKQAHNDWFQLAAEAGFVGAALLLLPLSLAAVRVWQRAGLAGRWALGGCALIAAHGLIDFPFHNTAVVVLWALLLATAHRAAPASRSSSPAKTQASSL